MMKYLFTFFFFQLIAFSAFAQAPVYVPHTIIVKIDGTANAAKGIKILSEQELATFNEVSKVQAVNSFAKKRQDRGGKSILDGIYKVTLNGKVEEQAFINSLSSYKNILYAERYPNVQPLEIPNDPSAKTNGPQYHLSKIKAYDAWSSTRSREEIVIAIIDTGVDLEHVDLVPNLYVNEGETIDGIDNDGDGFIDNYYGWDFADNDNLPEADADEHGTVVAGVAAAATNNAIGIAGVGYNTKFMPIKIFTSNQNVSKNSYEAIIYAADQGCDVINLSWGNTSGYFQYAQDVINYAVLEKNAVVVAAGGNTNQLLDFYPASYDHVLSVGSVDKNDFKSANATYSYFMDIVAPGVDIYTTKNNDAYGTDGGSSLSSPMVSGAAALIKAFKPTLNALEIMEQLRINTDDISTLGTNSDYVNQLGKGRLNIFKALNNENKPSVRLTDFTYTNGFEQAAYYGDTLSIQVKFKNYLAAVEGLEITMSCDNPFVSVIENTINVGDLARNEEGSNRDSPLRVVLADDIPEGTTLYFQFTMKGAFYDDYQVMKLNANLRNRNFQFGNWNFSLSATANLGLNTNDPFSFQQVQFNGNTFLKHQGIFLAASADSISKNIAVAPNLNVYSEDFKTEVELKRFQDITADFDVRSEFKESENLLNPLGISVRQRVLGWSEVGHENYLLFEYELLNKGAVKYDSLFFNFFSDWSINNSDANNVGYDSSYNLAYATDELNSIYVGFASLMQKDSIFYALDIGDANNHISDLENDTLTNELIWKYSKLAFSKLAAGNLPGGNDVASIQGNLLTSFAAGQSRKFQYVLAAANSVEGLREAVDSARSKYQLSKEALPFGKQIQLCIGESAIFQTVNKDSLHIYLSPTIDTTVYQGDSLYISDVVSDSVLYYELIDEAGFASRRQRLILNIIRPKAFFQTAGEPYLLTPGEVNTFTFNDLSEDAVGRAWYFSNGYESSRLNPKIPITEAGMLEIQLIAENKIGCKDTLTKSIEFLWRGATPNIQNVAVCKGESVILSDNEIGDIAVYADSTATVPIFRGSTFMVANIQNDTIFYVRNENESYPSVWKAVEISILQVEANFDLYTDINSNSTELRALAVNSSNSNYDIQWLFNGSVIGTSDSVYVSLENMEGSNLELVVTNDYGCTDTAYYSGLQSVIPQFDSYFLCKDEPITIKANNSNKLYFFADESLTSFLGKGSSLTLNKVDENAMVYAVNVADILPSEVVQVPILVSTLTADFTIESDTLNLAYDQKLAASANSNQAKSFVWDLGDGNSLTGKDISYTYTTPGIYTVVLSVEDSLNCVESKSKTLVVFDDPILGSKAELRRFFKIFPNPANQILHLEGVGNFSFDQYQIIDLKGNVVLSSNNEKPSMRAEVINIKNLPEGVYYLVIKQDKAEAPFMFMVKR